MDAPNVNNLLPRLQRWYRSQCNGVWEHSYGVTIRTLDNPGWTIDINLEDTKLEGRAFTPIKRGFGKSQWPNDDWMSCSVEGKFFKGAGDANKLAEMIATFLNWAEQK